MKNMRLTRIEVPIVCGLAGFSVPAGASVNARQLAHSLLTQIEMRGNHASGFAWYTANGEMGVYKQNKPGSQLNLGELPRDAKTVILHTRYATQGDARDNRNNHPVVSTDNRIALVHNGVISNDHLLRDDLGITAAHGEVDSLVIPSAIAQHGLKGLSSLSGYAAIAWLDGHEDGTLHIAKLKSSPVSYTWLDNGTFVMASTSAHLELALIEIDYTYGGVFDLGEGRLLEVEGGFITAHDKAPSMTFSQSAWKQHSSATAGGHASRATGKVTTDPATASGSEDTVRVTRFTPEGVTVSDEPKQNRIVSDAQKELDEWRAKKAREDMENQDRAMVLFNQDLTDWDYSDLEDADAPSDDEIIARMEAEEYAAAIKEEGYYLIDAEGGMEHFPTIEDLEGRLAWYAKMSRTQEDLFGSVDDKINWVNHIMDLGSVQKGSTLESWVEDRADIDNHESAAVRNLQYIREGAGYLGQLKGA